MAMTGLKFLALYEDETYSKPIETIRKDKLVKAGTRSEIVAFVKNVSDYELVNIQIHVNDSELVIFPNIISSLKPLETAKLTFIWSPSLDRTTALNAVVSYDADIVKRAR